MIIRDKSGRSLWVEFALKFKYFYRKVLSAITLIVIPTPGFTWSVLDWNSLDKKFVTVQRMFKYELKNRAKRIIKLSYVGNDIQLKKLLMRMGFLVDVVWGASKYADMAAVKDLEIPMLYAPIWAFVNWFFVSLPLPKLNFFLPGFGKKRLHIRIFTDKVADEFYITSHVDNTNPFSLSIRDKKKMYQEHFLDKIDGDYAKGEELLIALLERSFLKQKVRL